ncbi:MAG: mannonate dehydratase, partial [Chloroflexota bacterium]|nr:mannonate dehydratase [Chloroflexota bacterium]
MYLGTQFAARTDADYETFKQLGVNNINGFPDVQHQKWTVENLIQYREKVESFGLNLDMVQLPLSSADIDTRVKNGEFYNILTGTSPERDYEIERICEIISMCSDAGIPAVKYNLNIIGIPRTKSEFGRGGAKLSTFRWDEADKNAPDTYAGKVSEDVFWERIDYFLDKVVPVAEEKKVRLACHPHDPYTPPGYKGVTRVLGTVEGLKKFISIRENEYHGLNFCQGTITEMMDNPGEEIFDVIRYFGNKNKIFNVHFRNIKGNK